MGTRSGYDGHEIDDEIVAHVAYGADEVNVG